MCGTTRNLEMEFGDINNLQYAAMPCLQDKHRNAALQHNIGKVQHSQSESACCDANNARFTQADDL
jgi:hypothetical protein